MSKINCNVTNCSHNDERVCYANIINVTGGTARDDDDTSCASFLDSLAYSQLKYNVNAPGDSCSAITCEVSNCTYNASKQCNAEAIVVNGNNVNIYSETNCSTYKHK